MANGLFGTNVNPAINAVRQVAIQPAGVPGSTYVRPVQREAGGNLAALADALGGLNGALQNFGAVKAQKDRDPDSDVNRQFLDSIQGKTPDELREIAKTGGLNRIQQDGLNTLLGSKAASEFRQFITEKYNTEFDQSTGDFNSWMEAQRQQYAQGLPDQASQAAFFRATEEWAQRFAETDLERKVSNAMTERNTAVVDEFRMIVDDNLAKGVPADQIAAAVIRQSGLNRDFRGLDGKAQNETLFALANEYALKGEADLVKAILNDNRGGIGPLLKVTGFTDRGLKLIEAAEDVATKNDEANSFNVRVSLDSKVARGDLTPEEVRTLQKDHKWLTPALGAQLIETSRNNKAQLIAAQAKEEAKRRVAAQSRAEEQAVLTGAYSVMEKLGGAFELRDIEIIGPTGQPKTVTAERQKDWAIQTKLEQFKQAEEDLVSQGADPEEARKQIIGAKLTWFDRNGLINPEWDKKLNSNNVLASLDRIREGGEVTEQLAEYAETYRQIYAANPSYAAKLVQGERTRDFFESYVESVLDGATPSQALATAARVANRTPTEQALSVLPHNEARVLARRIMSDADSGFEETPANVGWIIDTVQKHMRLGMSKARAIAATKEQLQDRIRVVHGVIVPDHRDLPQDFEPLAEMFLSDVFAEHGAAEGLADPEDLYITPVGGESEWAVVRKYDGLPVGDNIVLTPKTLQQYRERVRQDELRAAREKRDEDEAMRQRRKEAIQKRINKLEANDNPWARKLSKGYLEFLKGLQTAPEREAKEALEWAERKKERQKRLEDAARKNALDLRFPAEGGDR